MFPSTRNCVVFVNRKTLVENIFSNSQLFHKSDETELGRDMMIRKMRGGFLISRRRLDMSGKLICD